MFAGHTRSLPSAGRTQPCFQFLRSRTCKFGKKCKYSHDTSDTLGANLHSSGMMPTHNYHRSTGRPQVHDGKLGEWKRLLRLASPPSRPSAMDVGIFFQLGLDMMDGDVGAIQQAVHLLAGESGLTFMKEVSDRHIPATKGIESGLKLWVQQIKPLFQLITHPNVVDSATLEQDVARIFNFLIGVGGKRMATLFEFVGRLGQAWPKDPAYGSLMEAVEVSLAVLSKMLDCNSVSMVDKKFSSLSTHLAQFLNQESQPEEEFFRLQATKYLTYIRLRLAVGEELPTWENTSSNVQSRDTFVLRRDLPGHLSPDGCRHDNDRANIQDIQILPTYKEIMSPRAEYLPTKDSSQWHTPGIRGRLDREFRLLREDTIGQLRDTVRQTLEHIRDSSGQRQTRDAKNSIRTYKYDSACPVNVEYDRNNGLVVVVRCDQPFPTRQMSINKRKEWWMHSKRLQAGALVCILSVTGSVLFCIVSEDSKRSKADEQALKARPDDSKADVESFSLSEDPEFLFVKLQLVEAKSYEINQVLRWYRAVGFSPRRVLVEFPGVLLASFKHTLAALQQIHKTPKVPFTGIICPPDAADIEVKPPLYARNVGFTLDLGCLTRDKSELIMSASSPLTAEELSSRSTLDLTQASALLNTLARELSLIQGPPGTGKSYTGEQIIKVLLANKKAAKLGPILCVCYTNHALDQLLEHLLCDSTKSIIRMGSRSKSESLQELNLRSVARSSDRTRSERHELYEAETTIKHTVSQGNDALNELSMSNSWRAVKKFLASTFPRQHDELFGRDQDEWEVVNSKSHKTIEKWLIGASKNKAQSRELEVLQKASVYDMSPSERRQIYNFWLTSIRDPIISQINSLHREYTKATEQRDRVRAEQDLRCLQQADIVGVTTTGLARSLDLLRRLRCKVMVCEEAGEVLEAHILTALLPSIEHAILIGDHLQLRPQIQNYELQSANPRGERYSLDMSLFERLVHASDARVPFSMLETQRRMHPSIAELVRSTLYPTLKDSDNVTKYPKVLGMKERLFWLHHEQWEDAAAGNDPLGTSHSNEFETEMTTALVSHLVRQGKYGPGDIAVITPYLGQLYKLRRRMQSMFEICLNDRDQEEIETFETDSLGTPPPPKPAAAKRTLLESVRIATVDNFQGEEAKIIVISLVRSNSERNCGFLRTSNRINVLLSRAQHGMYVIGNSDVCQNIPMWASVIRMLKASDHFGTSLELQCPRHPDTPIVVSQPDHFVQFSPESGCDLPCDKRLHCGHACTGRCHSSVLHDSVKCLEDCPRPMKGCDHPCPRRCGDQCAKECNVQLKNVYLRLPCGHSLASAKCWQVQDPASVRCDEMVTRTVPGCQHKVTHKCHVDVAAAEYHCRVECGTPLPCGHTCKNPCSHCTTRENGDIIEQNHGVCNQRCGRDYSTCSHSCASHCHAGTGCKPCDAPCEVRCGHSKCDKPCHEPCVPCAEKECQSSCPHSQCTMPCAAPCDWVPCSKRCDKPLICGHQCPSVCGELCPDSIYCQQCGTEEIRSKCVDFLEMRDYGDIDLNEDPCIFPSCGHFLTITSMDGQMDMPSYYESDMEGRPAQIKGATEPFSIGNSSVRVCATCRSSLRDVARYGRIVRRSLLDEATKKFIAWSNARYLELAESLINEHQKLETSPNSGPISSSSKAGSLPVPGSRLWQLYELRNAVKDQRYDTLIILRRKIMLYIRQVQTKEQPFQKVADLVAYANRQKRTAQEFHFDEAVLQYKGHLLAAILLLKCDIIIIHDFVQLKRAKEAAPSASQAKLDLSRHLVDCAQLISLSQRTMHPKEEIQSHIFYAQLCCFSRTLSRPTAPLPAMETETVAKREETDDVMNAAWDHLAQARALLEKYKSAAALKAEVDRTEKMLNDGIFYESVTQDELKDVYDAMATGLRGTGHWYTCQNGHPFTIGECGMPMVQATCPECGSPIGGLNHTPVSGVRHAEEMERIGHGLNRLRL